MPAGWHRNQSRRSPTDRDAAVALRPAELRLKPTVAITRPNRRSEVTVKSFQFACVVAFSCAILLPQVGSSQGGGPSRLYFPASTRTTRVTLAAESIVREDPPPSKPTGYASIVRLQGDVEIRTCCVQFPPSKSNPNPARAYIIMHADQATYDSDTGEIEAHGTVRVHFQNTN
jgi:hypothetical protein